MTKVTMKAVDTMHVSAAGPDNIAPGATFEINETEAKQLEGRGLATRVSSKAENKAMAAPEQKPLSAETAPTRARKAK